MHSGFEENYLHQNFNRKAVVETSLFETEIKAKTSKNFKTNGGLKFRFETGNSLISFAGDLDFRFRADQILFNVENENCYILSNIRLTENVFLLTITPNFNFNPNNVLADKMALSFEQVYRIRSCWKWFAAASTSMLVIVLPWRNVAQIFFYNSLYPSS